MNIDTNWKIEADSINVVLFKKVKRTRKADKTKYEDWEHVGYYATPSEALHGMVDQRIRDTHLTDLITISGEIDKLHTAIEGLPKTYHNTPPKPSSAIPRESKG